VSICHGSCSSCEESVMSEHRKPAVSRTPSSSLRIASSPSTPVPLHATPPPVNPPQPLMDSPGPSAPSTPPPHSQKSRAKDLLRKHYGLGIGPPAPLPGKVADPMNLGKSLTIHDKMVSYSICLDSTAFDPRSYYEQLITTSSLIGLLKKENELLTGMPPLICRPP